MAGTMLAGVVVVVGVANAQQAQPKPTADAAPSSASNEIVVTGSRIARKDYASPVPIQTLTSEALERSGDTNVIATLRALPAIGLSGFSSTNSNFDNNNSGVNTLNLRNLGDSRTLVLVDGRRFVAGVPGDSAVDINAIPSDFISRVEVVTGGASAVYGSEAIAGVVNIITKSEFEGFEVKGQYGEASAGDNKNTQLSITAGSKFAEDRGFALFNINYNDTGPVYSRNRFFSQVDNLRNAATGAVSLPQFSSFGAPGRFFTCGDQLCDGGVTVNDDGSVVPWSTRTFGFNRNARRLISVPAKRYQLAAKLNYDVSSTISAFADMMYTKASTVSELEPFPLGNDNIYGSDPTIGVPITNPFIPSEIRDAAIANGVDSIPFFRRQVEIADRGSVNDRDTYRFTAGLKGDFSGVNWDVSYVHGETQQAQESSGQVNVLNYRFALDAITDSSGAIVCRDPIARAQGCVPINIFGAGKISAAAAAYVAAPASRSAKVTQDVFAANLRGELPFELQAGRIAWAAGGEYREESSRAHNDALTQTGLNANNALPNIDGRFDVLEGYGEVLVPLLKDVPFAHAWNLELAGRRSNYSTVGAVSSWEAKTDYAIVTGLTLRAGYAEATRAPNIGELFDPGSQDFPSVQDPCQDVTATSTRPQDALCRAIPGMTARIVADGGAFTPSQTEIQGVTGYNRGNTQLKEENATTKTLGIVFQPSFLNDLRLSVDYYDIKVADAITSVPRNYALQQCYATGNPVFCSTITRNARAVVTRVDQALGNVANLQVQGYDITAEYRLDLDKVGLSLTHLGARSPGIVQVRTVWGREQKNTIQALSTSPTDDSAGFLGDPKNKVTTDITYTNGGLTFSWQNRYIGKQKLGTKLNPLNFGPTTAGGLNFVGSSIDAWWYNDVQARYDFTEYSFFVGAKNVFDKEPPLIGEGITGVDTGTTTEATLYDVIGRQVYVGFKARF